MKKSLTQGATHVTILLPVFHFEYDVQSNIHTVFIVWGNAEKKLEFRNDFFRYNPEKVEFLINDTLGELCALSKPYSLSLTSVPVKGEV